MSRYIDRLPQSTKAREVKLVVLTPSRSGTLGLYQALKILGFHPYHLVEGLQVEFASGVSHLTLFQEALEAQWEGKGEKFGKKELDKWLAEYDCIVELPSYLPSNFVTAYPNATFLLMERSPASWAKSMMSTAGLMCNDMQRFPLNVLRKFDGVMDRMCHITAVLVRKFSDGKMAGHGGLEAMEEYYKQHIAEVKRLVPPEKLHIIRLEDGMDWKDICPLLDVPVPDVPWPPKHDAEEFKVTMGRFIAPAGIRAMVKASVSAVAVAGLLVGGLWYASSMLMAMTPASLEVGSGEL